MSNTDDGDMTPNLAEALVDMAVDEDRVRCFDCGGVIDLSDADSSMQVLAVMHRHKESEHE